MPAIYWLDACPDPTAAGAGGKGSSLIQLHEGGFPVPHGFLAGAAAYQEWIEYNGLQNEIDRLLEVTDLHLPKVAREATALLTPFVAVAGLPPRLAEEVAGAHRELQRRRGTPVVAAVRSSALSEDGSAASSAGLYETYLNIRDEQAVLESLARCYRSLWAPRAVQYRAFKKLDSRREAMGVVVMEMIPAQVAGVAFTVNPVTGNTAEVMINASWGLGEAIVSGRVTPDSFLVRKADLEILRRDIYEKELMILADPAGTSGTITVNVPRERVCVSSLDDGSVRRLAELCLRIERYYGRPQDVEWAIHDDELYVLQSRAVTGLG